MRKLDEDTIVSGQLFPEEVANIATLGVTRIINNRPDGEEPGQPAGSEIEAAARAAGLDYRYIPMGGGLSAEMVQAMADALGDGDKVLAFCRSGARSTYLWALARAGQGANADELVEQAAIAGYDLSPIRNYLR